MIKIISGTCRTSLGLKTAKDGAFALPEAEEQRLIDRKVAARVYREAPQEQVATPPAAPKGEGEDVNPSGEKTGAEGGETAHLDPEQLKTMKLDDLKQLAKDIGVDTAGLRTKDDYARAIADVQVIAGPELSVEDVVE